MTLGNRDRIPFYFVSGKLYVKCIKVFTENNAQSTSAALETEHAHLLS